MDTNLLTWPFDTHKALKALTPARVSRSWRVARNLQPGERLAARGEWISITVARSRHPRQDRRQFPPRSFARCSRKAIEPSLFGLLAHLLSKSRKYSRGHRSWHSSAISDHRAPALPPGTFRTWSGHISGRNTKKSQEGMGLVTQLFPTSPENRRVSGKG